MVGKENAITLTQHFYEGMRYRLKEMLKLDFVVAAL